MAITNIGFAGPVDTADWYYLNSVAAGTTYGVEAVSNAAVSIKTGTDRTVSISPGNLWGRGVFTKSTAVESVTLPAAPASGSRWDMIVLRRDWAAKASTFTYVKGSTQKVLPTRTTNAGVLDEQPLALVRIEAGKSDVQEVVDLRCYASMGGATARDELALGYLARTGARVIVGSQEYQYWDTIGWSKKYNSLDTGWVNGTFVSGWGSYSGSVAYIQCRKAALGQGYMVEVRARFSRTGSTIAAASSGNISNVQFGRLPTGFSPTFSTVGLHSGSVGLVAVGSAEASGNLTLSAFAQANGTSYDIVKGSAWSLYGFFFTD
jgi:hypothetical protein